MSAGVNETAVKACVIGYPVKHSLSPLIHNDWLKTYKINGHYDMRAIKPERLKDGVNILIDEGYAGFNVTIPHKQTIMDLCDELDETAMRIGAVNTVSISGDKRIYGMNTDAYGFIENIKRTQPEFDFKGKNALVLGAGGAARAALYGLKQEGTGRVLITNRTGEKAHKLAADFGCEMLPWQRRFRPDDNIDLIVNTTSLGMEGQPALDFDLSAFSGNTLVNDIVYRPLETGLILAAQARNMPYVTGIGMLLHQARPAFQYWFGVLPDVTKGLEEKIKGLAQ